MKDKLFSILQNIGRSFMLPIAILPVAGLFLGIGGSFTNTTMLETYGLMGAIGPGTFINSILTVMRDCGDIVFGNLPMLFAMGVAIGMAKSEKAVASLAAAVAFFVMHSAIGAMINVHGGVENMLDGQVTVVDGITSLQMGVFGGIIVGFGVAYLHNRFYKIELPAALSFFSGTKFVPIISAIVYLIVGIAMFYLWPSVQICINKVGELVRVSGYFGTWIYGFMERILIPFGLHHVFYIPFWQTSVGGSMEVAGKMVEGAQNIFFTQLADTETTKFSIEATRFMSGKFPLMIFGLPGAALAMYKCAKPEKRKIVGGLLFSAALTSFLTGITEPIEFTFLFVAPFLYLIHCAFAGAAYMLMHIFKVGVGMTFSGGFIDMFLFGILQGQSKTNWLGIVIVGIGYFIVYYLLFSFLIKKFDLETPGREKNDNADIKLYTKADVNAQKNANAKSSNSNTNNAVSIAIVHGLGGKSNIESVDCCITRLRCTVFDSSKVKEDVLKSTGAAGVVKAGKGVQVIYGPRVPIIKANLEEYIENSKVDDEYTQNIKIDIPKQEENKVLVNSDIDVISPVNGQILDLSRVPDEVFSNKLIGDGFAVETDDGDIYSPVDAQVKTVFDTKHAIGLSTKDGLEVIVHMGVDTVKLDGEGFEVFVKVGDTVKAGDKLAHMNKELISEKGYATITPIVFTNLEVGKKVEIIEGETVKGDAKKISIN